MLVLVLLGCRGEVIVPLSFYIVSEEKIEGGRYVDTPDFPKVGYIAAKADLIIVRLAAVTQDVQVIGEGKTDFKEGEIPEVV